MAIYEVSPRMSRPVALKNGVLADLPRSSALGKRLSGRISYKCVRRLPKFACAFPRPITISSAPSASATSAISHSTCFSVIVKGNSVPASFCKLEIPLPSGTSVGRNRRIKVSLRPRFYLRQCVIKVHPGAELCRQFLCEMQKWNCFLRELKCMENFRVHRSPPLNYNAVGACKLKTTLIPR